MLHILNVIQPSITEDRIGNIVRSYHNHQKTLFQFFFCVPDDIVQNFSNK